MIYYKSCIPPYRENERPYTTESRNATDAPLTQPFGIAYRNVRKPTLSCSLRSQQVRDKGANKSAAFAILTVGRYMTSCNTRISVLFSYLHYTKTDAKYLHYEKYVTGWISQDEAALLGAGKNKADMPEPRSVAPSTGIGNIATANPEPGSVQ